MAELRKAKNNAVEFWRIAFTIGVMFFHFNVFTNLRCLGRVPGKDFHPILTGGWVLGYFLFLTGYFMMASYMKKEKQGLIDHEHAYKPAWAYFWSRIKGLMPAFVLGTLFVFIVRNIAIDTPISKIPVYLVRAGFEFLGLYQIGMNGMHDVTSNADLIELLAGDAPSGVRAGIMTGGTPLWNGPGWYISAIIIVSVLIYYVLCKNKDFFVGFFCPLMIIGCYGFWGLGAGEQWDRTAVSFLGLPTNLIRVTGGLCVGALMYFVVDWLKKHEISKRYKVIWNIVAVGLAAFFIYTLIFGITWTENQHNLFLIPFTAMVLVGDDVVSKFLSGPLGGFSAYVGKLSLYMYISHWGWVYLLPAKFAQVEYLPMAGMYVLFSFITANVLMLIDDKCIKPLINRKKAVAVAA